MKKELELEMKLELDGGLVESGGMGMGMKHYHPSSLPLSSLLCCNTPRPICARTRIRIHVGNRIQGRGGVNPVVAPREG